MDVVECRNHHKRCDFMLEDKEAFKQEFKNGPKAAWKLTVFRHFGYYKDEPRHIDFEIGTPSSVRSVLENKDILVTHIIPRLNGEDGFRFLTVCKRWGKIMATTFLKPHRSVAYMNTLYHDAYHWHKQAWYKCRRREKEGMCIKYVCDCQMYDEISNMCDRAPWLIDGDEIDPETRWLVEITGASSKFKPTSCLDPYVVPFPSQYSHHYLHW